MVTDSERSQFPERRGNSDLTSDVCFSLTGSCPVGQRLPSLRGVGVFDLAEDGQGQTACRRSLPHGTSGADSSAMDSSTSIPDIDAVMRFGSSE